MAITINWPKELYIHENRLQESIKNEFLNRVKVTTREKEDILKRFLEVIQWYETQITNYFDQPEFLYFLLDGLFLEGKNAIVIKHTSKISDHPGLLLLRIKALINTKQFEAVEELLEKATTISKETEPVFYISALANSILYSYYSQAFDQIPDKVSHFEKEYNRILVEKNQISSLQQQLLLEEFIQGMSVNIAMNRRKGNLIEGSNIGKQLIEKARPLKNRFLLNRLLNNTALCLIEIGHLKEGLELLEEAFDFSKVLANEIRMASFANNIGFIYRQLGYLDFALRYFEIAIDYGQKIKNADHIIVATETNIAFINLAYGNLDEALAHTDKALETMRDSQMTIPPRISIDVKLCRADIFEMMDKFEEACDELDFALAEIAEAKLTAEVAKVSLRRAHIAARQSNLGDACKQLEQTLEIALEKNLYEIIINAKLQLAEIDLINHRISGQERLLHNALEKIEDTKLLCTEQEYKIVLVDVLILQGLVLSLAKRKKPGIKVLKEAIGLAEELNLHEKEEEAKKQLKEIKGEEKNLLVKIFTRMTKSIRSTFTFESVAKPKVVETKLKALYIITKTSSLPIYEKYFAGEKKFDANLISGLLSAVRTMGETLLDSKEGGLKLIDHGDVAVMLETLEDMVFALVVSKESYIMREKLREFAKDFAYSEFAYKEKDGYILKDDKRHEAIESMIAENFH